MRKAAGENDGIGVFEAGVLVPDQLGLLSEAVGRLGLDVWLQVDGGVDERTIEIAAEAGANTFVAGSSVFNSGDPGENIAALRAAAALHAH